MSILICLKYRETRNTIVWEFIVDQTSIRAFSNQTLTWYILSNISSIHGHALVS